MKSSINTTILSLAFVLTLFSISFVSPIQSKTTINKTNPKNDIITQTCAQTPYPTLCESTLRSNPKSSSATVRGLALIMVDAVKAKADETLVNIDKLLKRARKSPMPHNLSEALRSCKDMYKSISESSVPMAIEAITTGAYKFAEQGMSDASSESDYCEKSFSPEDSPLTKLNKDMHDVGAIASAIVRVLMY